MFAGLHRAAELAAVIYSLIATCKLQNPDPAKWLDDVLRRIPNQAQEQLVELLSQFRNFGMETAGANNKIRLGIFPLFYDLIPLYHYKLLLV